MLANCDAKSTIYIAICIIAIYCQYIAIIAIYIVLIRSYCNIYCNYPDILQYLLHGSRDITIYIARVARHCKNIDIASRVAILLQYISPIVWGKGVNVDWVLPM